jgi:hypothetical protein
LFPVNLRHARNEGDNAIEYRNIFLLGAQGSGKTTTAQALAWSLGQEYGIANTTFAIQLAGIDRLLSVPTRVASRCWLFVAEDITLAKISKSEINQFFQIRHLITQNTGLREGMAVTMFNSHTFHGLDKNLRDTFNALIIKSVPTNPYDRSILKRYFHAGLLDLFEKHWTIDKALVWTPEQNHGVITEITPPPDGSIEKVTVRHSLWSRLFRMGGQ